MGILKTKMGQKNKDLVHQQFVPKELGITFGKIMGIENFVSQNSVPVPVYLSILPQYMRVDKGKEKSWSEKGKKRTR